MLLAMNQESHEVDFNGDSLFVCINVAKRFLTLLGELVEIYKRS